MARPREFDLDTVLDAAMHTFWAKGYAATSMADLMAAMDLHKGSIYKAFGDKHQLFLAALQRYLDRAYAETQAMLDTGAPHDALRAWLLQEEHLRKAPSQQMGCFAVNAVVERAPHDAIVQERMAAHFSRVHAALIDTIQRGQADGSIRLDQSPQDIAAYLTTVSSGLMTVSRAAPDDITRQRIVDVAIQAIS